MLAVPVPKNILTTIFNQLIARLLIGLKMGVKKCDSLRVKKLSPVHNFTEKRHYLIDFNSIIDVKIFDS